MPKNVNDLFGNIARYIVELKDDSGHSAKRRKIETDLPERNGDHRARKVDGSGASSQEISGTWPVALNLPDISFSAPQRKKYTLQIGRRAHEGVRANQPSTGTTEFGISWKELENIVCLPVPEKAQAAYNFCAFPRYGDGVSRPPPGVTAPEPIVWTVAEKDIRNDTPLLETVLATLKSSKISVQRPDAAEFASQITQAHRKGEKAYHVKAFRGSKDGFLFFLKTGIVWGFKKPLFFFGFDSIDSISYTSVLQRTFDLNIATRTTTTTTSTTITSVDANNDDEESSLQEFEFSMIDQADFASIDEYIKRHRLQDASMAEQRRAKKLNINGVKTEASSAAAANAAGDEEESELAKASRAAEANGPLGDGDGDEDEEEEDDENFDPGSEGESEGSGDESEEDEDGNENGEGRGVGGAKGEGDEEDDDDELGEDEI